MAVQYPIIIDVEASGFGSYSYPIEVGFILENQTKYCTLVKPENHWVHWDYSAESLHHIKRDELVSKGKSAFAVAQQLNAMLQGKTVYSDAWVVDQPWLIRLFEAAGLDMQFNLSSIELILNEQQINLWDEMKVAVIEDLALRRHRSSNDAHIVQETFSRTLTKMLNLSA